MGEGDLVTLTYTSRARADLTAEEIERIHASAMTLNALDGITGFLIYNGEHFLQTVEGSEDAIDDLMARIRADPRHSDIVVREVARTDAPGFPDWSMALVRVSRGRFQARADILQALPPTASPALRDLILQMSDLIST